MENGEIEMPNQEVFSGLNDAEQTPSSCSMESFFDEIFKDTHACTHTHTCNPPGPDLSHTHTCFHVHTKILSAPTDGPDDSAEKGASKKRPFGNREAVRKYREKKKARAASLEDEVAQLRELNRQLMRRLQGQAALEAEVMRLRCLLVDIRGRIDGEIGSFPYQKPVKGGGELVDGLAQVNLPGGAHFLNSCDLRCDDQVSCLHPGMQGNGEDGGQGEQGFGVCDVGAVQCLGGSSSGPKDFLNCGREKVLPTGCVSSANRKKAGTRSMGDC
uniref:AP-1-like transcription factor n=1 Tax=Anthurium amnicola TaxID=1678845 RepID=A0A1D1XYG1_9ARAE